MQLLSKIYSPLSITLVDQGIVSLANFLVAVLLVRFLGVEAFGVYSLLWMSILFLQSLQTAIIITPMMTIGSKQLSKDKNRYHGAVISHQILFSIVSSIILYVAIVISNFVVPQWGIINYAFSLSLVSFLSQNQDFLRRLFFLEGRTITALVNDLICYIGRLLVLFVVFISSEPSLKSVFSVMLITLFLSVSLGVMKLSKTTFDYKYNIEVFKRHWKMSNWLTGSALLMWFSGNYFVVAAAAILGPAAVGVLRASGNIIGMFNVLFLGLENIIPQSFSKRYLLTGSSGLRSYLMKLVFIGGALTTLASILLSFFSESLIIAIYGEESAGNGYVLIWYCAISIFQYFLIPFNIGLRTLENTKPQFVSQVLTMIFSVVTANFLISNFELNGVMFGMLVNQLIMLCVTIVFFFKTLRQVVVDEKGIDSGEL